MRYDRLDRIIKILEDVKSISLDNLCERLKVSKNTVRRDIAQLKNEGKIKKFYGGVRLVTSNEPVEFIQRLISNKEAKKTTAQFASGLIKSNEVIFIDAGTTTMHIVPFLIGKSNVTIITTSLDVMLSASQYNLPLIGTGGSLYGPSKCFVGDNVKETLKQYNLNHIFMSSTGITLNGATNASPLESENKKFLMGCEGSKTLLIDHSKFGKSAMVTYAPLDSFDRIVTDREPPSEYLRYFMDHGIEVIFTPKEPDPSN